MNSNITNFFQVRVQVRVQKFLFFEFDALSCRMACYKFTNNQEHFSRGESHVSSVAEWLKCRADDQHGLGSKPTRAILLRSWEKRFTTFSPAW